MSHNVNYVNFVLAKRKVGGKSCLPALACFVVSLSALRCDLMSEKKGPFGSGLWSLHPLGFS